MKNNQNDVSKRLDRDEFIRYIETLTLDQIVDLMPYEIYYKTEFDDINLPKQTSFGCHKKHIKIQLKDKLNGWNTKSGLGRKVASDYSMVANQTILIVAV